MIELIHGCEVCHKLYAESAVIKVEGIEYQMWKRVFPWYICLSCAKRISDALRAKDKEEGKPLTESQKALIKLFKDGQCTDGYLMTKLGIFDWEEAQKLIEQYEREGKNE